jgi:carbon monoxide dehydrogenase subunit G
MRLFTVSRILLSPVAEVWAITSSFGAAATWIPGISRVALTGYGVGAVRVVTTPFGILEERLTLLDPDQHRIRYSAKGAGMEWLKDCVAGTDLTAIGPDRTRVDWVLESDEMVDIKEAEDFLTQFFEAGIAGLAKVLGVDLI